MLAAVAVHPCRAVGVERAVDVAHIAQQDIAARPTGQAIAAQSADQIVVAGAAAQHVIAPLAVQDVPSGIAVQPIIAAHAIGVVVQLHVADHIGKGRRMSSPRERIRCQQLTDDLAVVAQDHVRPVARRCVGLPGQVGVGQGRPVAAINNVVAVGAADHVVPADQIVLAGPTVNPVIPLLAQDHVVARSAVNLIVPAAVIRPREDR